MNGINYDCETREINEAGNKGAFHANKEDGATAEEPRGIKDESY